MVDEFSVLGHKSGELPVQFRHPDLVLREDPGSEISAVLCGGMAVAALKLGKSLSARPAPLRGDCVEVRLAIGTDLGTHRML